MKSGRQYDVLAHSIEQAISKADLIHRATGEDWQRVELFPTGNGIRNVLRISGVSLGDAPCTYLAKPEGILHPTR